MLAELEVGSQAQCFWVVKAHLRCLACGKLEQRRGGSHCTHTHTHIPNLSPVNC
jgi:hypothetical protein